LKICQIVLEAPFSAKFATLAEGDGLQEVIFKFTLFQFIFERNYLIFVLYGIEEDFKFLPKTLSLK